MAAIVLGVILAGRAGVATNDLRLTLEQGEENGIGSIERQYSVRSVGEVFHRPSGRRAPLAVYRLMVAADAPQLSLHLPHEVHGITGEGRLWPHGLFRRRSAGMNNDDCRFGRSFWLRQALAFCRRGIAGDFDDLL